MRGNSLKRGRRVVWQRRVAAGRQFRSCHQSISTSVSQGLGTRSSRSGRTVTEFNKVLRPRSRVLGVRNVELIALAASTDYTHGSGTQRARKTPMVRAHNARVCALASGRCPCLERSGRAVGRVDACENGSVYFPRTACPRSALFRLGSMRQTWCLGRNIQLSAEGRAFFPPTLLRPTRINNKTTVPRASVQQPRSSLSYSGATLRLLGDRARARSACFFAATLSPSSSVLSLAPVVARALTTRLEEATRT